MCRYKNCYTFDGKIYGMSKKIKNRSLEEYKQGLWICILIIIIGIFLEWMTLGAGTGLPRWPANLFIGIGFGLILWYVHYFYRDIQVVKFLSRVPASVTAIVLFTSLTLIMGLSKQNDPEAPLILKYTGLSHVRHSFSFLLSGLYLLTILGLVILRRITPVNYKNIGFTLNHLGLWIIVFAGSLGAGDLQRLNIYAKEGEMVRYAYDRHQQPKPIPFHVKLIDFDITFYNPKIAYITSGDFTVPEKNIENNFTVVEEGLNTDISGYNVAIEKLILDAQKDSTGNFVYSAEGMTAPAAKIKVSKGELVKEGWISYGNFKTEPSFLDLGDGFAFAMAKQEAKEYSSLIYTIDAKGISDTSLLVVNQPVKVRNWQLYQLSYDEKMGKYSKLSIIEAIRDPWLPVVYIGIFMVIFGSLYLFTIGKKIKEN